MGLYVFVGIGIDLLKLLAGFMVVFTLVFLWQKGHRQPAKNRIFGHIEQLFIGGLFGIMGASVAMPGPIPAAWMAARSYDKDTICATILAMLIVSYTAAHNLQIMVAGFTVGRGRLCFILALPTAIGVYFGSLLVMHLTEDRFTQVLTVVLFATALSLFFTSIPRLVN